jgi:hypothetical protein
MESLNQRKQELEKKEVQLKESVIKFDKFLKVYSKIEAKNRKKKKLKKIL